MKILCMKSCIHYNYTYCISFFIFAVRMCLSRLVFLRNTEAQHFISVGCGVTVVCIHAAAREPP